MALHKYLLEDADIYLDVEYRYIPAVATNWNCPMEDAEPASDHDAEIISITNSETGDGFIGRPGLDEKIITDILESF